MLCVMLHTSPCAIAHKHAGEKEDVAQLMESTLGDISVAEAELQQLKDENRMIVSQSR